MRHNFWKLKIWQVAMEIVDEVYKLSKKFPKEEMFALTTQTRKAAVAMPSNISEGAGRNTNKDFSNFIDIALGSSNELITELLVAQNQNYVTVKETEAIVSKIIEWQNMTFTFQQNNLKE